MEIDFCFFWDVALSFPKEEMEAERGSERRKREVAELNY